MKADAKNTDRSSLIKELKKRLEKKWEKDKLNYEATLLNEKTSPLSKPRTRTKR